MSDEGTVPMLLCRHGEPARRLQVKKNNRNHGRFFWRCQHWHDPNVDCGYFEWCDNNSSPQLGSQQSAAIRRPVDVTLSNESTAASTQSSETTLRSTFTSKAIQLPDINLHGSMNSRNLNLPNGPSRSLGATSTSHDSNETSSKSEKVLGKPRNVGLTKSTRTHRNQPARATDTRFQATPSTRTAAASPLDPCKTDHSATCSATESQQTHPVNQQLSSASTTQADSVVSAKTTASIDNTTETSSQTTTTARTEACSKTSGSRSKVVATGVASQTNPPGQTTSVTELPDGLHQLKVGAEHLSVGVGQTKAKNECASSGVSEISDPEGTAAATPLPPAAPHNSQQNNPHPCVQEACSSTTAVKPTVGAKRSSQKTKLAPWLFSSAIQLVLTPAIRVGGKARVDVVADGQSFADGTVEVCRHLRAQFGSVLESTKYSVFIVDTETTGLSPTRDRIVELSILSLSEGMLLSVDLNPGAKGISREAARVTGMTNHEVQQPHRPSFSDSVSFILDFISAMSHHRTPLLVAHNALFDMKFIAAELLRCGVEPPGHWMYFDTYKLGRLHGVNKKTADGKLKLGSLGQHYTTPLPTLKLHTARSDVLLLAQVLPALLVDVYGSTTCIDDVVQKQLCTGHMAAVRQQMRGMWKPMELHSSSTAMTLMPPDKSTNTHGASTLENVPLGGSVVHRSFTHLCP